MASVGDCPSAGSVQSRKTISIHNELNRAGIVFSRSWGLAGREVSIVQSREILDFPMGALRSFFRSLRTKLSEASEPSSHSMFIAIHESTPRPMFTSACQIVGDKAAFPHLPTRSTITRAVPVPHRCSQLGCDPGAPCRAVFQTGDRQLRTSWRLSEEPTRIEEGNGGQKRESDRL